MKNTSTALRINEASHDNADFYLEDEVPKSPATASLVLSPRKLQTLIVYTLQTFGFLAACTQVYQGTVTSTDLWLFGVFFVIANFGFEGGYHRYFSHGAFKAKRPLRIFLALLGSVYGSGSVVFWTAMHRTHHRYSDREGDPHSPNLHGSTFMGKVRGQWHAYVGYLLKDLKIDAGKYAPDLVNDKAIMWFHRNYLPLFYSAILIPGLIEYAMYNTPMAFFHGLIWGGLFRVFVVRNAHLALQTIAHAVGNKPYDGGDNSRNNMVLALLSFGGWHNTHHAFPYTYSNWMHWWELDPSSIFIRVFAFFGWATDLRFPTEAQIALRSRKNRSAKSA